MFGSLGPFELILIFLVVLLLFGAKRIPEIARGVGSGIKEFKDATREITSQIDMEDSSRSQRQVQQPRRPQQGNPTPREEPRYNQPEPPAQPTQAQEPSREG